MIAAALVAVIFIADQKRGSSKEDQQAQQALDSLRFINKKLVTFDSIQTASQNRFLDSLSSIKKLLEYEKVQRLKETRLLRKQNQELENRFNSISLPDRPDF